MVQTIYATFPTKRDAERAVGALMDHGVSATDISFIVPERLEPIQTEFAGDYIPTGPDSSTPMNAPASHHPVVNGPMAMDIPTPDPDAVLAANGPSIFGGRPTGQGQDLSASRPLPGYSYDAMGAVVPDTTSIRPAVRQDPAADRERVSAWSQDPTFAPPSPLVESGSSMHSMGAPPVGSPRTTMASDMPIDVVNADHGHIIDNNRELPRGASGITTSTGRDAAYGAAGGAGIGLGLGLALGLATVLVPGIGLVVGAGALIASLSAATAVAGGVAGGVYGYLTDLGVPPDTAHNLDSHLKSGGPILSVHLSGTVPQSEIAMLLEKYGANSAEAF